MRNDVAHLVGVRAGCAHTILSLTHLRGRNHLHRLGDLARVLHALDLSANFLCTRHVVLSECVGARLPRTVLLELFDGGLHDGALSSLDSSFFCFDAVNELGVVLLAGIRAWRVRT